MFGSVAERRDFPIQFTVSRFRPKVKATRTPNFLDLKIYAIKPSVKIRNKRTSNLYRSSMDFDEECNFNALC